ncbi:MAG TPA: hypothetical protein VFF69_04735, partial [Phycisphaerales bacterium]|nr:hypothetical protein [Phycisphaerales bacterium]
MRCVRRVHRLALHASIALAGSAQTAAAQCSSDKLSYPGSQSFPPIFGGAVAIGGDVAAVGAPQHAEGDEIRGGAFAFRRAAPHSWPFEQKLVASDGAAFDSFGSSVAAAADVVIVSAPSADAAGTGSGAAYVFRFDGSGWSQEQKLVPDDGAPGDGFGRPALSGSGDLAVVAAAGADPQGSSSGAAYVFRFSAGQWVQEQKLVPSLAADDMYFGWGVATDGQRIAVGAAGYDTFSGAVFIFEHAAGAWVQTHVLLSPSPEHFEVFGSALALDGDRLLVGAPGDSGGGPTQGGAAYVLGFDRGSGDWLVQAKLEPAGRRELDNYGSTVAISGDTALLGKNPHDPTAAAPPAVFVNDGAWSQRGELRSSFGSADAIYGGPVALSGGAAIVGSRLS